MPQTIETQRELDSMTVPELRAFLLRHDVMPAHVQRVDGTSGPPRKADLYAEAMIIRARFVAAHGEGASPNVPAQSPQQVSQVQDQSPIQSPPNIFQQGSTPPRGTTPGPSNRPAAVSLGASQAAPTPARSSGKQPAAAKTPSGKRRSSVGWINPRLLQTMQTPSRYTAPAADPAPVVRQQQYTPQTAQQQYEAQAPLGQYAAQSTQQQYALQAAHHHIAFQSVPAGKRDAMLAAASSAGSSRAAGPPVQPVGHGAHANMAPPEIASETLRVAAAKEEQRRMKAAEKKADRIPVSTIDSDGDEVIQSDGEALSEGGGSVGAGSLSDADSTFLTDGDDTDDERPRAEDFHGMRVSDLKVYLSQQKVSFPPRAKKAELVAIARAHVIYLEGLGASKAERPSSSAYDRVAPIAPSAPAASWTPPAPAPNVEPATKPPIAAPATPSRDGIGRFLSKVSSNSVAQRAAVPVASAVGPEPVEGANPSRSTAVPPSPRAEGALQQARGTVVQVEPSIESPTDDVHVVPTGTRSGKVASSAAREQPGSSNLQETARQSANRKIVAPQTGPELLNETPIDVDAVDEIEPAPVKGARQLRHRKGQAPSSKTGRHVVPKAAEARTKVQQQQIRKGSQKEVAAGADVRSRLFTFKMPEIRRVSPRDCGRAVLGLVLFLCWLLLVVSLYNIYQVSLQPFCPEGSSVNQLQDGSPCRPCPEHGSCEAGGLICAPGYRRVDSRCAEDEEVALYADSMASYCAGVLRDRAGRKDCGESIETVLSTRELRELLKPSTEEITEDEKHGQRRSVARRRRGGHQYDSSKFEPAFDRALAALDAPDNPFGVRRLYSGYTSTEPILPLACVARRFVFRNWRPFATLFVVGWLYLSFTIRRARKRRHDLQILDICERARELLWAHKGRHRAGQEDNPFLVDTHLRFEVLGNSKRDIRLWAEAELEFARDSRVSKVGPQTVKGHPCYVWEWVGRQDQSSLAGTPKSWRASLGSVGSMGRRSLGSSVGTPRDEADFGSTPGRSPGWSLFSSGYRSHTSSGRR